RLLGSLARMARRSYHPGARAQHDRRSFVRVLRGSLLALTLAALTMPVSAHAQSVGAVFEKVNPSVVVVRAKGRDVSEARALITFSEIGSGVLISADGKVMTAAHVVQAMDEITVESLGGETVDARVIASEPAADLSLVQLSRVPAGALVAPM